MNDFRKQLLMGWLRGVGVVMLVGLAACQKTKEELKPMTHSESQGSQKVLVEKTDAEWRKQLSPEQYHILREAGTEAPHGQVYEAFKHHPESNYHCAGCDALLFRTREKFDSGCGWPSFYAPADAENVVTREDRSLGRVRVEVLCARCGGHLGHVFEGEGFGTPTDLRYCINGGGLIRKPVE